MKEKLVDRVRVVIASGTAIDPELFLDTAGAPSTNGACSRTGEDVANITEGLAGVIAGVITIVALTFVAWMIFPERERAGKFRSRA
jgi:hypothetical protein